MPVLDRAGRGLCSGRMRRTIAPGRVSAAGGRLCVRGAGGDHDELAGFEGVLKSTAMPPTPRWGRCEDVGKIRLAYCLVHARRLREGPQDDELALRQGVIERIGAVYVTRRGSAVSTR